MSFFPVSVPSTLQLLQAKNNTKVYLDGTINDVITTIPVVDTSDIPASGFLTFEDGTYEVVEYTGKTLTTLTGCTRGADNTTPSSHADGAGIGMWDNARYHNILAEEVNGICQNLADRIGLHASQIILQDNLNANTKKLTGLAAGTVAGDSVRYEQVVGVYLPLSGGTMIGTLTLPPGSLSAPSLTFSNAGSPGNTGFYSWNSDPTEGMSWVVRGVDILSSNSVAITAGVPILFPNGSAGTPSISFTSDPNTGITWGGSADYMIFVTGGTARFSIENAWFTTYVPVIHSAGAVGSPSITWTGDTNTGFYAIAADTIGLSCGGALQWSCDTSNFSVVGRLRIQDGTEASPSIQLTSDTNTGIYTFGSDSVAISCGGTRRFSIDPANGTVSTLRVSIPAGTQAAPSLNFVGEETTGICHESTGYFTIVYNNTSLLRIRGVTGDARFGVTPVAPGGAFALGTDTDYWSRVFVGQGSQTNPSVTFNGENDCGLYINSTNQPAMAAGGTRAMIWGPTGTVDGTTYMPFAADGGGTAMFHHACKKTVTTASVVIIETQSTGNFAIVFGYSGTPGTQFMDLVMYTYYNATPIVIASRNDGSPATRTYTSNLSQLKLQLSTGTYSVYTKTFDLG